MFNWKKRLVERKAAKHVAGVLGGIKSPESWRKLSDDPDEFAEELNELYEVDFIIDSLSDDKEILQALSKVEGNRNRSLVNSRMGWAVAASILLVIVIMGSWLDLGRSGSQDAVLRYVTRVGEQKEIDLDDGSQMTLNTGSEVLVRYSENERSIVLNRGEAFFDVKKEPNRIFRVDVGEKSVAVLGTRFNVLREREGLELSVEEGKVLLCSSGDALDLKSISIDKVGEELLPIGAQRAVEAGWKVRVFEDEMLTEKIEDVAGWRDGVIHFVGVSLVDVIKELNRYSAKKILIEDPQIMEMPVTATVNVHRVTVVLRILAEGYGLKLEEGFDYLSLTGK